MRISIIVYLPLKFCATLFGLLALIGSLEAQEESPYFSKHLEVFNARDSVTLAGTLMAPDSVGRFPLAIFISGSGPQDRFITIGKHRPFLVIAKRLQEIGIASLCFDDRGMGESTGSRYTNNMKAEMYDHQLIWDAVPEIESGVDMKFSSVGLIGHSLGGMIALQLGQENDLDFSVLLATPFENGMELMLKQKENIDRFSSDPSPVQKVLGNENMRAIYHTLIENSEHPQLDSILMTKILELDTADHMLPAFVRGFVYQLTETIMRDIITYDPMATPYTFRAPTIFIYGSKDLQVPPLQSISNLNQMIKDKLSPVDYVLLGGMNHLLQKCKDGHPLDYFLLDEPINPLAVGVITAWLTREVKMKG
jgi:pimeloyl-ACP methyl ester carboxylesterase